MTFDCGSDDDGVRKTACTARILVNKQCKPLGIITAFSINVQGEGGEGLVTKRGLGVGRASGFCNGNIDLFAIWLGIEVGICLMISIGFRERM